MGVPGDAVWNTSSRGLDGVGDCDWGLVSGAKPYLLGTGRRAGRDLERCVARSGTGMTNVSPSNCPRAFRRSASGPNWIRRSKCPPHSSHLSATITSVCRRVTLTVIPALVNPGKCARMLQPPPGSWRISRWVSGGGGRGSRNGTLGDPGAPPPSGGGQERTLLGRWCCRSRWGEKPV